jgi:hypothetical protein
MAPYTDSDQLYACTKALFSRIAEQHPGAADEILASRMVIRLRCTEPAAELTLNGRRRPLQTIFGPSNLHPTLKIDLSADTLHRIMLGELALKTALARGLLKVQGPLWKSTALADLFQPAQLLYRQVLREQGLILS